MEDVEDKKLKVFSDVLLVASLCTLVLGGYVLFKNNDFPGAIILTLLALCDMGGHFYFQGLQFQNRLIEEAIAEADLREQVKVNYRKQLAKLETE